LQAWRTQYPKLAYPGQLTVDRPEVEPFGDTERSLWWYRPDSWWRTGRGLAARRFDAVVLSVFTPIQLPVYLALARAARPGGCKVVVLCHNVLPHDRRWFDESAMKAMLRCADAVIVHSAQEAALATALASTLVGIAALPLHLAHAERQVPVPDGPRPPRNRLLFFGMIRRYKGVDVLLRALSETKPDVALTIAGEIWQGRGELVRLVSDLQLADRVTLTDGYVAADDVPAMFAAADALVLPYRSGTASQNALMAQHFGVPVIATRAGAIADSIIEGVNGLLCAPDDVSDLARAINTLYEPGKLERLQLGVRPPDTARAWADYVAAVERAISAA
jgi:glycosyltransferase involved in cell wall biosynthesis